jgi:hypothetical protein
VRVVDLFAGLRGWSEPFEERGHEVFSVDIDPRFNVNLHKDILALQPTDVPWIPDVVLASPPCQAFSVMTIGRHWTTDHKPKTEKAMLAMHLVEKTLYFVVENPRAKLRKLPQVQNMERRTVAYCQYGENRQKPTDLWGGFPPSLVLKPMCRPKASCHVSAPRGSRTGTQGMDSAESAKIPRELALAVCLACETDLTSNAKSVVPPQVEHFEQAELFKT